MVELVAATVFWCQNTMAFESGVAKFESGPAWIAGPSPLCEPYTFLSPDGSRLTTEKPRVRPEGGKPQAGLIERGLRPAALQGEGCKAVYRLKTVDITFPKDGVELTKEQEGQLASLLVEKPEGFSVAREAESTVGRNTDKKRDVRVAAVRSYLERMLATRPSITEEPRVVSNRPSPGATVTVTAIYRGDCRDRKGGPIEGRQAGPGLVGMTERSKEGAP